jgi:hypothetical protein
MLSGNVEGRSERAGSMRGKEPAGPAPELPRIPILDSAWARASAGERFDAVRSAARDLRALLASGSAVESVRTLPLSRFPYPTQYAFGGAAKHPAPFVELEHRALLVQFRRPGSERLWSLLFNPTDVEAAKRTPFFAQFLSRIPPILRPILVPKPQPSLESQLNGLGVSPRDIDFVAFDHFHTQDLRSLARRFPRARLVAQRREWDVFLRIHPMQSAWYIADGREGVDESRVLFVDGDVQLGDGIALVRTPGHTSGNQTLFVKTAKGIWGCAENGTCADAWSPRASRLSGLRRHALDYGLDTIANSNTPESGADQLASMALESTIVDRVAEAPDFIQMFPSSELVRSWMAPGIAPTHRFGALTHGEVVR